MLGSPCSPCCGCTPVAAQELWSQLKSRSCVLTYTSNVPKCDAATLSEWAFAKKQGYEALNEVDLTRYGWTPPYNLGINPNIPAQTEYVEGHSAFPGASLTFALDPAGTSWNSTQNRGAIKFVYTDFPYISTLTITVQSGSQACVPQLSLGFSVLARRSFAKVGAGQVGTPNVLNVNGFAGAVFSQTTCALVTAPYYRLNVFALYPLSYNNVPPSVDQDQQILWATQRGKFCSVSAAWSENKKPESVEWGTSEIVYAALPLGGEPLLSGSSAIGTWQGAWTEAPRQWSDSADPDWFSSLQPKTDPSTGLASFVWWGYGGSGSLSRQYHLPFVGTPANRIYSSVVQQPTFNFSVRMS